MKRNSAEKDIKGQMFLPGLSPEELKKSIEDKKSEAKTEE